MERADLLDLPGAQDSAGVWAPSLSHHDGQFWLICAVVRTIGGPYKDLANCFITAPSIDGAVVPAGLLNASGFDPSLFHDDDGRR